MPRLKGGASPRPIENPKWFCANSNVGWVRISDISKNSRFLYKTAQKLSKKGIEKSRFVKQNSLIMSMCATIGK
ncbi:restriction endonuclease subunit S domain-containing protein, partial [Helicobacter pylori]